MRCGSARGNGSLTFVLSGLVLLLTPWLWERLERFDTGPDYRIPYQLSKDYWLYGRRLQQVTEPGPCARARRFRGLGRIRAARRHVVAFPEPGSAGRPNRFVNRGRERLVPARAGGPGATTTARRFATRR